jgi:hypothetical protein
VFDPLDLPFYASDRRHVLHAEARMLAKPRSWPILLESAHPGKPLGPAAGASTQPSPNVTIDLERKRVQNGDRYHLREKGTGTFLGKWTRPLFAEMVPVPILEIYCHIGASRWG